MKTHSLCCISSLYFMHFHYLLRPPAFPRAFLANKMKANSMALSTSTSSFTRYEFTYWGIEIVMLYQIEESIVHIKFAAYTINSKCIFNTYTSAQCWYYQIVHERLFRFNSFLMNFFLSLFSSIVFASKEYCYSMFEDIVMQ